MIKASEKWLINKHVVESSNGLVVSNHYEASEVGFDILNAGGNAIDAAVAMGLALGVVEPWMSGLGGCGYMIYHNAESEKSYGIDFGVHSPINLEPSKYILSEAGKDKDLFGWPSVKNDLNVNGPSSMATPGYIAGLSKAHKNFGSMNWKDIIDPACQLSKRGLLLDWYTTLRIALSFGNLKNYSATKNIFLPNGMVPSSEDQLNLEFLKNYNLANSYEILKTEGADSFYNGSLSELIVKDLEDIGSCIKLEDFINYKANIKKTKKLYYKGSEINVVDGLNAGPSLVKSFENLNEWKPNAPIPNEKDFLKYSEVLKNVYEHRLSFMGAKSDQECTTHLAVIDSEGNIVSLTQTLLSIFGSKVVLPSTGILMNNGIMWFDPRKNRPNSIMPNTKPLSNMCPAIVLNKEAKNLAIGASGGRKILPAVFQIISFIYDFNMTLEEAFKQPRIDMSGNNQITVNKFMKNNILKSLKRNKDNVVVSSQDLVMSGLFANPNAILQFKKRKYGMVHIPSPSSLALAVN